MSQIKVRAEQNCLGLTAGQVITVERTEVVNTHLDAGLLSTYSGDEDEVVVDPALIASTEQQRSQDGEDSPVQVDQDDDSGESASAPRKTAARKSSRSS